MQPFEFTLMAALFGFQFRHALAALFPNLCSRRCDDFLIPAYASDVLDHRGLDLVRVERLGRTGRPASLLRVQADVVAIPFAVVLGRVGMHHPRAAGSAVEKPLQESSVLVANLLAAGAAVPPESILHPLPKIDVNDPVVFAVVDGSLVIDLAGIDHVGQEPEKTVFGEWLSAALLTLLGGPPLGLPTPAVDLLDDRNHGLLLQVDLIHRPDLRSLVFVDDQPAAFRVDVVPKDRHSADPLALAARGGHLVPRTFRDDLPLELGEGKQDV
ncbi:MAG: hypothetical protein BWY06_03428 [Candidatus Latescibacteria bacterium ADurb.Bin168]|nr:MAG: hypothetical protein BWY06_03428 [Candidatus Latescibacteria bacterium ADurb.Bin168]